MSDAQNFGFGKLVPGFDFLQNLAKGASEAMPQMPGFSNWIAPTLSVDEVDKRISELRAVQFWLEQNNRALAATVQALEVQKMTLATLEGMNVTFSDLADALKMQPQEGNGADRAAAAGASGASGASGAAGAAGAAAAAAKAEAQAAPEGKAKAGGKQRAAAGNGAPHTVIDPLQWWSSLTQQFQQIAFSALQEAAQRHPEAGDAFRAASAATQAASDAMSKAAGSTRGATSAAARPASAKAGEAAGKPAGKSAGKGAGKGAARKAAGSARKKSGAGRGGSDGGDIA